MTKYNILFYFYLGVYNNVIQSLPSIIWFSLYGSSDDKVSIVLTYLPTGSHPFITSSVYRYNLLLS